ncbi:MAG: hypothetical protein WCP03_00765 [Candidatus Saccharibacteria bacterium]
MKKGTYLTEIYRSPKSVLTTKDISLMWHEPATGDLRVRLNYYVKTGKLRHLRRGLYVKDENYNKMELASRVFTPSYVSFETILSREGLVFQYHENITVASYLSRETIIDGQVYNFRKVKNSVLLNNNGIIQDGVFSVASKERALLDTLYSNTNYHFDNLRDINWQIIDNLLPIYSNKRLNKVVARLKKEQNDEI